MTNHSIAARFHFRNCTVKIKTDGEMIISRPDLYHPDEVFVDRPFIPLDDQTDITDSHNEFYEFLRLSSINDTALKLKCFAIGYMLCNLLPRGGILRLRSFVCCNETKGARSNGKSLFCRAIAELSNPTNLDWKANSAGLLNLCAVDEKTTVAIFEGVKLTRPAIDRFYRICPGSWEIPRRDRLPMVLDVTVAPYVLMTTWDTASPLMRYASDVCRFVPLIFSSYFSGKNSVEDHFGHRLFIDWDDHQWHLFDNFMLHCVREYLYYYREMRNPFKG